MGHVTEGLYLAAAAGAFVFAVSWMLLAGRAVDVMFASEETILLPGQIVWEVPADE